MGILQSKDGGIGKNEMKGQNWILVTTLISVTQITIEKIVIVGGIIHDRGLCFFVFIFFSRDYCLFTTYVLFVFNIYIILVIFTVPFYWLVYFSLLARTVHFEFTP